MTDAACTLVASMEHTVSEQNTMLSEIQNLPVAELADRLGGLTAEQLTELRALETVQKDGGRKSALAVIGEAIVKAAPPPVASEVADSVETAIADWQNEDYSGPLTIPQADWRRHNIKPVRAVREK